MLLTIRLHDRPRGFGAPLLICVIDNGQCFHRGLFFARSIFRSLHRFSGGSASALQIPNDLLWRTACCGISGTSEGTSSTSGRPGTFCALCASHRTAIRWRINSIPCWDCFLLRHQAAIGGGFYVAALVIICRWSLWPQRGLWPRSWFKTSRIILRLIVRVRRRLAKISVIVSACGASTTSSMYRTPSSVPGILWLAIWYPRWRRAQSALAAAILEYLVNGGQRFICIGALATTTFRNGSATSLFTRQIIARIKWLRLVRHSARLRLNGSRAVGVIRLLLLGLGILIVVWDSPTGAKILGLSIGPVVIIGLSIRPRFLLRPIVIGFVIALCRPLVSRDTPHTTYGMTTMNGLLLIGLIRNWHRLPHSLWLWLLATLSRCSHSHLARLCNQLLEELLTFPRGNVFRDYEFTHIHVDARAPSIQGCMHVIGLRAAAWTCTRWHPATSSQLESTAAHWSTHLPAL